jgi:hypothetical protein
MSPGLASFFWASAVARVTEMPASIEMSLPLAAPLWRGGWGAGER